MAYLDSGKIYAFDFDGTLCSEAYPGIGRPNKAMIRYAKELKARGNRLILWTCRNGQALENAVAWCTEQGIEFDAVNQNLPEILELFGSDSRKITADYYVDDRLMGVRLPDLRLFGSRLLGSGLLGSKVSGLFGSGFFGSGFFGSRVSGMFGTKLSSRGRRETL